MFPFLAPIQFPQFRRRIRMNASNDMLAEMTLFAGIPPRRGVDFDDSSTQLNLSGTASSSESKLSVKAESVVSTSNLSRPNSRQKISSNPPSQPTSARSAKSSPIPPPASSAEQPPPPPTRHRNKGLETSSAMLELFGGGSAFGADSAFQKIPGAPTEDRRFHRTGALTKELEQQSEWEVVRRPPAQGPFFAEVEDHEKAYERTRKRANWRHNEEQQQVEQNVSKPGPEKFDNDDEELPPDPECPAEKLLASYRETDAPECSKDWEDLNPLDPIPDETVPAFEPTKEGVPGPDLDEVEDPGPSSEPEVEAVGSPTSAAVGPSGGSSSSISSRRASAAGSQASEAERQSTAGDGDAEDESGGGPVASGDEQKSDSKDGKMAGAGAVLIRQAQVINDDSVFAADVYIEDGVIRGVGVDLPLPAGAEVIEAAGRFLLPAGIDVHTHFSSVDSVDDFATGCRAAVAGGAGTVVEVVSPKAGESLLSALARVKKQLDGIQCNVAFSILIRSWSDAVKSEMQKAVSEGVNSFIVDIDGDDKLYQVLEQCRSLGAHARVVPENRTLVSLLERKMLEMGITGPEGYPQSRPEELEAERVGSICLISQLTNCPISILSLSSGESVAALEKARYSGALAHPEVASAAVASDGSHYFNKCLKHASAHMTHAPLRIDATNRIVSALSSHPLAVCTSGHCAISASTRSAGKDFTSMPKGTAGVQERLSVLWEKTVRNGRLDPMRFVAVTSSNAAKMFNMYPKKGRIAVGADADLILWDVNAKRKIAASDGESSADTSIYEGLTVHAKAAITFVGGKQAWKDGVPNKEPAGAFVALKTHSPYLFSVVSQRDKVGTAEKVDRDGSATSNGVGKSGSGSHASTPDRNVRKSHLESKIDFGSNDNRPAARGRNPPGGRTTGFW